MNFTKLHNQSQVVEIFQMVKLAVMRSFGPEKQIHSVHFREVLQFLPLV